VFYLAGWYKRGILVTEVSRGEGGLVNDLPDWKNGESTRVHEDK